MADSRQQHGATLLPDGRVLISGGWTQDSETWNVLAATEIFDPGSGQFGSTGSMGAARHHAVTVLLNDGRVLIAGGWNDRMSPPHNRSGPRTTQKPSSSNAMSSSPMPGNSDSTSGAP